MGETEATARPARMLDSLSELWLTIRVACWLAWLPLPLYVHSLPELLKRLSTPERLSGSASSQDVDQLVRIAMRASRMPVFRLWVFPRICLRESLAVFRLLRQTGRPCEFHLGINKRESDMRAHAWVTLDGNPLLEDGKLAGFSHMYTYPAPYTNHR